MTAFVHTDREVGMTMADDVVLSRHENVGGTFYWKATQAIGTLFGQAVDGEITGIGKTPELARERLADERRKLNESLWM